MQKRIVVAILFLGWGVGWFSHDYLSHRHGHPDAESGDQNAHTTTPSLTHQPDAVLFTVQQMVPQSDTTSVGPSDHLQSFQNLLKQHRFAAALMAWPDEDNQQARDMVLDFSKHLDGANRADAAVLLLNEYYNRVPEDAEAGLLHANILHRQQHYRREVFLLMDMLPRVAGSEAVARVRRQLQRAVHAYTEFMMQAGSYRDLLDFYRELSLLDANNQDYMLMQATILVKLGLLQQASAILQPLSFDPEFGGQAKVLLEKIARMNDAHYQAVIPLKRSGEHFLVPVSINGNPPIYLLLDTGASITLVQNQQAGLTSGSKQQAHITLQTANGQMQVPTFIADDIALGEFHLHAVKLGMLAEPVALMGDGLLGMNVLRHFDFVIDQITPALKLTPRAQADQQ